MSKGKKPILQKKTLAALQGAHKARQDISKRHRRGIAAENVRKHIEIGQKDLQILHKDGKISEKTYSAIVGAFAKHNNLYKVIEAIDTKISWLKREAEEKGMSEILKRDITSLQKIRNELVV